jgi:hypothetical protein
MKTALQLVGEECRLCHRKIAFMDEAKICPSCGRVFHLACLPATDCDVCHQPLILGKEMRPALVGSDRFRLPSKDNWTLIVALVSVALLVSLILLSLSYALAHSHGK